MRLAEYLAEIAEEDKTLSISKLVRLSKLADEDLETFRELWPTIGPERRLEVVEALAQLAEDNVELDFDAVLRVCLNDEDKRVRVRAINGLWESEGPGLIDAFIQLLQYDDEPDVRSAAGLALGRFSLMAELDELGPRKASKIKEALLARAEDDEEAMEVRRRAVESLGYLREPAIQEVVRRFYQQRDIKTKASAICAMGHSADASWLPVLLVELESPEPELRFEAALACGEVGEERAVPHLARLIGDEDPMVQETAIMAIGQIGRQEAKRVLQRCMLHPDERVRLVAEEAMEELQFGEDPLGLRMRPGNNPRLS